MKLFYFCIYFNWAPFINNDLNIHYVISPGDMEMSKTKISAPLLYVGSMVKCMYPILSSHDKIKGVIVTCSRNNVLFTNDVTCQVYISDLKKKDFRLN